ncbi:MAG: GNAT family N-acetyltransferase [Acetobacterium woodii]|nr:GNAT family N-acetyltransferase [Acetobacterium woodii]
MHTVTDIFIRQVLSNDLNSVEQVEKRCFPEAEAASRNSLELRIHAFPECFLVAESDGQIIGFINGCVINGKVIDDQLFEDVRLHVADGAYQTIFGLDVIPEYRNQGIAACLMNHFITVSKDAGRKGLILTCKSELIHYYEKFGFIDKGISSSVHGGAIWYDMILEFK